MKQNLILMETSNSLYRKGKEPVLSSVQKQRADCNRDLRPRSIKHLVKSVAANKLRALESFTIKVNALKIISLHCCGAFSNFAPVTKGASRDGRPPTPVMKHFMPKQLSPPLFASP